MNKTIGFITSNLGKFIELEKEFNSIGCQIDQIKIDYPEIQADTIDEVSNFGLKWILKNLENNKKLEELNKLPEIYDYFLVEDSGLFVHSLNNFPGVYSKFVFKTIGYSGILRLITDLNDRSAHFESCIGLVKYNHKSKYEKKKSKSTDIKLFKGIVDGYIVTEPRGDNGFGYDPIFQAKDSNKTFAEMKTDEKNLHSHRGKAVKKLIEFLRF